jgi:hypothetical protein
MNTKAKPATPLPFSVERADRTHTNILGGRKAVVACIYSDEQQDAAYIAHAANSYPKLVEELKRRLEEMRLLIGSDVLSSSLLRELGEE